MNYTKLAPVLVSAIQQQQKQIEELKKENDALKAIVQRKDAQHEKEIAKIKMILGIKAEK